MFRGAGAVAPVVVMCFPHLFKGGFDFQHHHQKRKEGRVWVTGTKEQKKRKEGKMKGGPHTQRS